MKARKSVATEANKRRISSDVEKPRKRTRCLRSCLACRRSKQKCQLPDSSIEPNEHPLPTLLACRRCQALEQECYVVDTVPVPRASNVGGRLRQSATQEMQSPAGQYRMGTSYGVASPSSSSVAIGAEGVGDEVDDESMSPPAFDDLRIFQPEAATGDESSSSGLGPLPGASSLSASDTSARKAKDWVEVGRMACRPFEMLGYLVMRQSITRHQFTQTHSSVDRLKEIVGRTKDLCERYEAEVKALEVSMPLLPSFDELRQAGEESDLLIATVLYLSFRNRQEEASQARILPLLRQRCLSCLLHSPRNIYDVFSLILTALHLPLLLATLSDGRGLDGLGLLSSAASAACAHECNGAIARLSPQQPSPGKEARQACLWMSLCLYTTFAALAGNVERQPLVQCSWEDVEALEAYSEAVWSSPERSTALQRQSASILLLVFRTRATMKMREMCRTHVCLLKDQQDDEDRDGNNAALQQILKGAIDGLQACVEELKEDKQRVARRLGCYGWRLGYCLDVLSLDLALLQILCLNRHLERLFEQMPTLVGPITSSTDFLSRLLADPPLHHIYILAGTHRADIARHILALFMNTVQHACSHKEVKGGRPPLDLVRSIPTNQLCSILVTSAHSLAEVIDGKITAGHTPHTKVGDSSMEMGEVLLRGTSQSLMQLGAIGQAASESSVKEAIQLGNLYVLSAGLSNSLIRRFEACKAVADGAAVPPLAPPSDAITAGAAFEDTDFAWHSLPPDEFEDLFREILCTPFEYP